MTKDEIKQTTKMIDVLSRYGLRPNRAGFICCPFHMGDRTASMKIYKDSYYCFGCGATGDIFEFVRNMDHCSFKDAFLLLGGSYQKPNASSRLVLYHHQKKMQMKQKEQARSQEKLDMCLNEIDMLRMRIERLQPLSDPWCDLWNRLQLALYHHGFLTGLEGGD